MRKASTFLVGSLTALALLTAPALARTSDQKATAAQPAEDGAKSSGCVSYQQKPDGTWQPLSCQEGGGQAQSQKPAVHSDATAH
jgi:hypothetical protein